MGELIGGGKETPPIRQPDLSINAGVPKKPLANHTSILQRSQKVKELV